MRFTDRTAIVTGAGRGIGAGIAQRLMDEGAKVAIVSRTEANANKVAVELNALTGSDRAVPFAVDVSSKAEIEGALPDLLESLGGRVDVLVNNAGVTRDGLLMRMSEEDWDTVLDTNLKSVFLLTGALLKTFSKQRYGRLVHISSVAGVMGNAGQCNYAASKAGLIGFSKSLAKEMASRNITSNVVAPGFIATDMTEVLSDKVKEEVVSHIPLGRFGAVEDIASAVAFLASEEAAYITGQVLLVDGGMVM
ncbi:MAG: 3-oxoacyl-[acyl-carrier-protein] reductase [Verrucomicrobiales bacterium]